MAFNYSPLSTTAKNLITNFGQSVTFTRFSSINYNPASGVASSSTSTYSSQIVLFDQIKNEDGDTNMQIKEFPASMHSTTAPKIGDTATINSEKLRIVEINPIQPGSSVVYYELRLRG